ncbi:DUF6415 family natural product biosynthesis protein [Streptomyces sp. NPDC054949]|uniref:DUF6415 family natural product biosynthesis protein n=1 Tax=unclassified Streptomyces TaxID=2593676 RepID=UPI0006AEF369|nr:MULTISPECIES: DUF6415 family natural product biosynthesis protein [unclassified Streptomyces]KOU59763.1 hypothetical protein ADK55_10475 [Streptomyces sp. WM4235]MCX5072471.1 DUF6415 family natural product biosynthesis protein [Streptomyces sp. NBC_00424]MCX5155994.1 DUF6415 family natural product biosynthesis protein [Streptomyces sp. NBC_00291]WUD44200.1 DUF6415 family natural product biosynthesis protein [Streptomyces sp. NBC_00513]
MTPDDTQHFEELAARALTSYEDRPDAVSVARLVDDLITAGQTLHATVTALPADQRTERVGAALVEWTYFIDVGPLGGDTDHANWNHARNLARIARVLAAALAMRRSSGVR